MADDEQVLRPRTVAPVGPTGETVPQGPRPDLLPPIETLPAEPPEPGPEPELEPEPPATVAELSEATSLPPAAEPAPAPAPLPTPPPEPTEDARLAAALWATGRWGARHVAATVVGPAGPIATMGKGDRRFALASVTKLLLGYACLVAVEEGTLSLDEPAGPPDSTVAHLLAHAAGLGFDTGVVLPPAVKRIYSNTGYDTLAEHLADRAGMPAVEYLRDAVLEPLAMEDTDVPDGSLAHGGWSTVDDLGRFATELLKPTLVHPLTLAVATSPAFPKLDGILPGVGAQSPNDWGLSFELRDHKAPHWTGTTNSPSTFGHFGAAGTFLWVDPAIDRALVVLTDRSFGPWALEVWPPLSDAVVAARLAV